MFVLFLKIIICLGVMGILFIGCVIKILMIKDNKSYICINKVILIED